MDFIFSSHYDHKAMASEEQNGKLPSEFFSQDRLHLSAAQAASVHRLQDFAKRFVVGPVLLLLLLAEVSDHLAAATHLQVADLVRHRAHAEPVSVVGFL